MIDWATELQARWADLADRVEQLEAFESDYRMQISRV